MVNNLITFGSQHMGISDIPGCKKYDVLCEMARTAARRAVYGDWAQNNIIQVSDLADGLKSCSCYMLGPVLPGPFSLQGLPSSEQVPYIDQQRTSRGPE